jgi:hypothetical protein
LDPSFKGATVSLMTHVIVLDKQAEVDFYSASSFKQQTAGKHVAPLGHIILVRANQSLLLLLNAACVAEKQQIPILKSLV